MKNIFQGMFWEVEPKRQPPEPIWEADDYLPNLFEAMRFEIPMFSDEELYSSAGSTLIFDCEVFCNYFLVAFRSPVSKKCVFFEISPFYQINYDKLKWVMQNFEIVGFNSKDFDLPITTVALARKTTEQIKYAANQIVDGMKPYEILRNMKIKSLKDINHIDLIEIAPLTGSLKKYAARLHVKRMQDLPFRPTIRLTPEQMHIVRLYCVEADIPATALLYDALREQLDLRRTMSASYGIDMRSRSDAQLAEDVMRVEITRATGLRPTVPDVDFDKIYKYNVPNNINYVTSILQKTLDIVRNSQFELSAAGSIELPKKISDIELKVNNNKYTIGIGGLHSCEKNVYYEEDELYCYRDIDVESFYPKIVLNQELYPEHLGRLFLDIFKSLVDSRIQAKREAKKCKESGDKAGEEKYKALNDSAKITINGTFGKFGSIYSIMFSPQLLIQVTLSGQLYLLMLIEMMEIAGIEVVSANTDGIVLKVHKDKIHIYEKTYKDWEEKTNFKLEESKYKKLSMRDVNNYIAVKDDGEIKGKGIFANPWSKKNNIFQLHKNPANLICTEAVERLLADGVAIEETIRSCKEITKFVTVRDAKGGAVKVDAKGKSILYMGKMLRWYYSDNADGEIVYAKSGNKIARSENSKPLMDLPDKFPSDINYQWYIDEARSMLK